MNQAMDWQGLMRAGMHGLGLAPDVFWSLTPAELRMMLGDTGGGGPLLNDGLAALMAAYPDRTDEGTI
ncbi:rcc01693 family protein [Pseudosulfitobacter sp. DSM 107133]|uniref:rcc01693 family protein n=1 Tax=Pseudosulfitobacter sp. DSM 107133 TaxID=2883100 RepID=UPI000DF3F264|nr:rcc01693 family protein [Pseudosulfitobacter sp. DSM 107133]UOA26866.1 hypothetical protein DSM107133_01573 [Pseudosulfitobacter sp. DSM 107133]